VTRSKNKKVGVNMNPSLASLSTPKPWPDRPYAMGAFSNMYTPRWSP
jgi:hypothetical protein